MSKEDKDLEEIRKSFKKLEELQNKADYYKNLKETMMTDEQVMDVEYLKKNILKGLKLPPNQNKDE